jgi:Ca2+:H+ antiporter
MASRDRGVASEKRRASRDSRARTSRDGGGRLPTHRNDVTDITGTTTDESNGVTRRIKSAGESGRSGIDPLHFLRIIFRSSSMASRLCNVLWPLVPAAIAVRYTVPENHLAIFIVAYLAMIPCANLIGFAGEELARKMPHVWGVLIETTYVVDLLQ